MHDWLFTEPHFSEFVALLRSGAGTQDIHDGQDGPYAQSNPADDALVGRELDRVRVHRESLCALLERFVGSVDSVLDVGCGTGGTTVAMALSTKLNARSLTGVDPNEAALKAAAVRTNGYGLQDRITYQSVKTGEALPFESGHFDLTTCISVLEFIGTAQGRRALVAELCRVTRPGGHIALFTPNFLRLREYHTRRWFGHWRRGQGYPWSSSLWQLRSMFEGMHVTTLSSEQLVHGFERRRIPGADLVRFLPWAGLLLPWQKLIVRKPE